jgi:hypothetical protein
VIARYVEPKITPMLFESAREALLAGLRDVSGNAPSREVLALGLAKCALETGRFQKIWNWNFGNIKASSTYPGMYTAFELNEVLKGQVVWFGPAGRLDRRGGKVVAEPYAVPPAHPQTRMRAHANRFDGAFAYGDFMRVRPTLWQALQIGEPYGFVHSMKRAGYFTADEAPYARAVASLYKEFLLKIEGKSPPVTELLEPTWNGARALALALAASHSVEVAVAEGLGDG